MRSFGTPVILFLGLFYAFGLALLGYALWSAVRSRAAASWERTPGTLTRCTLENGPGRKGGTAHEVKVEYTYAVGGREYTGSRLAFGYVASSGRHAHTPIYEALKDAKAVEVRYDPSDPARSTLSYGVHRSIQSMLAFALTWLAFVVGFHTMVWLASRDDNVLLRNLVTH